MSGWQQSQRRRSLSEGDAHHPPLVGCRLHEYLVAVERILLHPKVCVTDKVERAHRRSDRSRLASRKKQLCMEIWGRRISACFSFLFPPRIRGFVYDLSDMDLSGVPCHRDHKKQREMSEIGQEDETRMSTPYEGNDNTGPSTHCRRGNRARNLRQVERAAG